MNSSLSPLLLLAGLALLGVIGYIIWREHKARVAAWSEFASRHEMNAQGLRIEGSYEGYPLTVETESRGSGKHRYTVTVLRLSVRDVLPPEFSLKREGLGDKVLQFFGKQDEELGDEAFDRHFKMESLSPEFEKVLRRSVVQEHLYEMVKHYRDFHIRGGCIQAEHGGILSSVDALEEFTGPALMLAHTLEETSRRTQGSKMG
jgi:hypothetical protein